MHPGFQYKRGARFTFSALPAVGDTLTIGSETFVFAAAKSKRYDVAIAANVAGTLANLRNEWLIGKQAPYESLTLAINGADLEIYSTSSSATGLSETSANISVQLLGSGSAATQTEVISDPARYYDGVTEALYDDGRNSLGASDGSIGDYNISVAHHSGYQQTAMRGDKDQTLEPDTVWGCVHVDGIGGTIAIHKWGMGAGRMESVEPFTLRLGLTVRGTVGEEMVFDSNIGSFKSKTTDAFLTSSDTYGKGAGHPENVCLVTWASKDSPGTYYPDAVSNIPVNGNKSKTDFRHVATDIVAERNLRSGASTFIGDAAYTSTSTFLNIKSGTSGNSEIRFSSENNDTSGRFRVTPSSGQVTIATKASGTGTIATRLAIGDTQSQFDGHVRPLTNGAWQLGGASARWTEVFAVTGTINTSDEREKDLIDLISDLVLDAWHDVKWVQFKWKDAIAAKGDLARMHFGLIAQQVRDAFESHGLDPYALGVLCYDQWDDQLEGVTIEVVEAEIIGKDGDGQDVVSMVERVIETGETKVIVSAGDRFGIRYQQAHAIEAAYQRRRIERIERSIQS